MIKCGYEEQLVQIDHMVVHESRWPLNWLLHSSNYMHAIGLLLGNQRIHACTDVCSTFADTVTMR